jgi:hypothetical protein
VVAFYFYSVLIFYELLASASCDMPEKTGHSGTDKRRIRRDSNPRPMPRSGGGGGKRSFNSVASALAAPVSIARSADEKKNDYYQAQYSESKSKPEPVFREDPITFPSTFSPITPGSPQSPNRNEMYDDEVMYDEGGVPLRTSSAPPELASPEKEPRPRHDNLSD